MLGASILSSPPLLQTTNTTLSTAERKIRGNNAGVGRRRDWTSQARRINCQHYAVQERARDNVILLHAL